MAHIIKCLSVLILSVTGYLSFGQKLQITDQEKALNNAKQALLFEEKGKLTEAIPLLEEAHKLDSGNINYPYELGVVYYSAKDYAKAVNILEPLLKHKDVYGMVYQVLGNVYDNQGKTELAISTYEKGLKLFPNTAELYLELGNVNLKRKAYEKALDYYEKGIEVNPAFASNYYWAAKLYCNSSEPIWGMFYGEIFLDLESNSDRTPELSKLLFDTYAKNIRFPRDSSFSVSFSKSNIAGAGKSKPSFAKAFYEPTVMLGMLNEKNVDINSLCRMRKRFLEIYMRNGNYLKFPNALLSYQYKVLKAGHIDAYNHWILAEGDKTVFNAWIEKNRDSWDKFIKWFSKNQISLDNNFKFYRGQYN